MAKKKATKKTGGRKKKRPPVRYKRNMANMIRVEVDKEKTSGFRTGMILEFSYGKKQKPGQVGGWKNDPKPRLLIFHDDGDKYIEGLNTNYLSDYYLRKLRMILRKFPGIDGEELYSIIKRTAHFAIKKGYRKYLRSSVRNEYLFVYEDELENITNPFTPMSEDEYE